MPLGELLPNESLRAADGPAVVLSRIILNQPIAVYNIEVHGEHVYQVGELGVLVHNTVTCIGRMEDLKAFDDIPADVIDTWRKTGRTPAAGERIGWFENKKWLMDRVNRGDSFALVTDPSTLPNVLGGYINNVPNGYFTAKEFELLKRLGIEVMELW